MALFKYIHSYNYHNYQQSTRDWQVRYIYKCKIIFGVHVIAQTKWTQERPINVDVEAGCFIEKIGSEFHVLIFSKVGVLFYKCSLKYYPTILSSF